MLGKCEWSNCTLEAVYATYATQHWGEEKAWRYLCDNHEKHAIRLRKLDERMTKVLAGIP
uniref:Uncharacterized protein n=1 Tax=viral metagenome TaxID=1070528 RepID=A0A6M3KWP9_9ZZZZ